LRVLLDSIAYLWPFRIVKVWDEAGYYIGGRMWRKASANGGLFRRGIYFVVPFFTDVVDRSRVPAMIRTARIDLTLDDGTTLTAIATAWARMVDFDKAVNGVDDFYETSQETFAAVVAERLAEVDVERLSPSKRKRWLTDLTRWVNEETMVYGVEVTNVRFTTFVLKVKTYRFMQDLANAPAW
jgi:hypothetical protein